MKTITILCLHLGYGGIEKYISSLCEMLKDDFKIKIISTYKIYDEPVFYIDKKIDIEYLIECKPCKEEMYESLKNKQIFSFINYGIKNAKLLYLKNKLNGKRCLRLHFGGFWERLSAYILPTFWAVS